MKYFTRQFLFPAFLLVTALLVSACSGSSDNASAPAAMSNYEKLPILREQSGLTKEFALAQFVAYFGPMESAPEYTYDNSMPIFATAAVAEIMRFESELEPDVIAEIYQKLIPVKPASQQNLNQSVGQIANAVQTNAIDTENQTLARDIAKDLSSRFGRSLQKEIEVASMESTHFLGRGSDSSTAYVVVEPLIALRNMINSGMSIDDLVFDSVDSCWIVINEDEEAKPSFDDLSDRDKRMIIAHEVVHCFQTEIWADQRFISNDWIIEGTAAWAGEDYVDGSDMSKAFWWPDYEQPNYALLNQSYSALGFWSHVDNTPGFDLWSKLPTIYESTNGVTTDDFSFVFDLIGSNVYETWAPGRARRSDWSPVWNSIGVGGRTKRVQPELLSESEKVLEPGETALLKLESKTSVNGGPTILQLKTDAFGGIGWEQQNVDLILEAPELGRQIVNICVTKEECVCENGTALEGYDNVRDTDGSDVTIAIASGKSATIFQHEYVDVRANCPMDTIIPDQPEIRGMDSCVVGTWALDMAHYSAQRTAESTVGGQAILEYRKDGNAADNIKLTFTTTTIVDGKELTSVVTDSGKVTWQWSTLGNKLFRDGAVARIDRNEVVTLDGVVTRTEMSNLDSGPTDSSNTYTCSEEHLVVNPGASSTLGMRYNRVN